MPEVDNYGENPDSQKEAPDETPTIVHPTPAQAAGKPPKPSKYWHYETVPVTDNVRGDRKMMDPNLRSSFKPPILHGLPLNLN